MKFVHVLEDDPRFQKDIVEAIVQIDPKIQVRFFSSLAPFAAWIKKMMQEGAPALTTGGTIFPGVPQEPLSGDGHQLALVISKVEFMGADQLKLLKKTQKILIERALCTKEDPTSLVLTAHDDPSFDLKSLEDRVLNNILFKPFDRLILLQHLTFAIDGRHPPSKYTIANQKTTALVEMLKDAPIESFSEIGFLTRSQRPIEIGKVAKYYGTLFTTDRHRSVMALCESCEPDPAVPGEFIVSLNYFAADPTQISNFRKKIKSLQDQSFQRPLPTSPNTDLSAVILDAEESGSGGISGTLERKFSGVKATVFEDFESFYSDLDPAQALKEKLPKPFDPSEEAQFEFDPNGKMTLSVTGTDGKPLGKLFETVAKDFLNQDSWFDKHIAVEDQKRWRSLFHGNILELPKDPFFAVQANGKKYLVKINFKDQTANKHWTLKIAEANKQDWENYLVKTSKLPKLVDALFISHRFLGENPKERWMTILEILKKRGRQPKLFLLSPLSYSDAQEREMAEYFSDIFFQPVDRNYLVIKMKSLFPGLKYLGEKIDIHWVPYKALVKVAGPITITEISEAGFVMEYYRSISIGSFREMVLWQPYEIGAPELLSNCNFSEEVQGKKGVFHNHFVFFGVTDHFLKNIRIWIRDNYVASKEQS